MSKTWDQKRNAQVLNEWRSKVRQGIWSIRYYRSINQQGGVREATAYFKDMFARYRQANKVLSKNL